MSRRPLGITFYPEDFADSMAVLTTEEFGALTRLVLLSVRQTPPCSLPNDNVLLARAAGLAVGRWDEVKGPVLSAFGEPRGERISCHWLLDRWESSAAYKNAKSRAGRRGGLASGEARREANAKQTRSTSEANTNLPVLVPVPGHVPKPPPLPPAERVEPEGGGDVDPFASASWDRNAAVEAIVTAYPPSRGGKHPAAVRQAIYALGGPMGKFAEQGQQHAAEWLLAKVRAYASSPYVKSLGEYVPGMREWMNGAMYDVPESEWSKPAPGKDEKKQAPAPTYRTGALARMKAEEEARRRTA